MNIKTNKILMGAALAGMVAAGYQMANPGSAQAETKADKSDQGEEVFCYGANSCKGKSDCHTASNDCAGQNSCKSKGVLKLTQAQCKKNGGTLTESAATDAPKT